MRVFFAIPLSDPLRESIYSESGLIKKSLLHDPIKWVPKNNLHITLKFLGDVTPTICEKYCDHLSEVIEKSTAYELTLSGIGVFPNLTKPRIVWVGCNLPNSLLNLFRTIENVGLQLGFLPENRPFSAHITIGRLRYDFPAGDKSEFESGVKRRSKLFFGTLHVDHFCLFKSELNPTGPVYSPLKFFKLIP